MRKATTYKNLNNRSWSTCITLELPYQSTESTLVWKTSYGENISQRSGATDPGYLLQKITGISTMVASHSKSL